MLFQVCLVHRVQCHGADGDHDDEDDDEGDEVLMMMTCCLLATVHSRPCPRFSHLHLVRRGL